MNDHRSKFSNLSNWKEEEEKKKIGKKKPEKKKSGLQRDSNPRRDLRVTGALLYQLSYEATHWERGQFIEFISPVRSEIILRIQLLRHFSYSFGTETINTFIRSRSFLQNHTRFQTKIGKVFSDHRPYPLGRHIPIWII